MLMQTQVHLQHVVPVVSLQRPFATANQSGHTPKCHLSKQGILTSLAQRRGSVKAEAAGLDEGVTTSSGLLGPSTQTQRKSSSPEPAGDVGGVELASEVLVPAVHTCAPLQPAPFAHKGAPLHTMHVLTTSMLCQADMDYTSLRDALQQGDFQQADDLTRAALITLAGPDAEKRNWVYFSEVKFISNTDLQTIDKLWRAASKNRYALKTDQAWTIYVAGYQNADALHICSADRRPFAYCSVGIRFVTVSFVSLTGKGLAFRRRCGCKIASSGQSSLSK